MEENYKLLINNAKCESWNDMLENTDIPITEKNKISFYEGYNEGMEWLLEEILLLKMDLKKSPKQFMIEIDKLSKKIENYLNHN